MTPTTGHSRSNVDPRVVAVVAAGGALGALARHGLNTWLGTPWSTFLVNISGCLLIGILMATAANRPILRPFLGTGVLGGFTTFSAYALDFHHLVARGHLATAFLYLTGTLCGALLAVWLGLTATERAIR